MTHWQFPGWQSRTLQVVHAYGAPGVPQTPHSERLPVSTSQRLCPPEVGDPKIVAVRGAALAPSGRILRVLILRAGSGNGGRSPPRAFPYNQLNALTMIQATGFFTLCSLCY